MTRMKDETRYTVGAVSVGCMVIGLAIAAIGAVLYAMARWDPDRWI